MHLVDDRRYACWGLFHDWDPIRSDFRRRLVLEIARSDHPSAEVRDDSSLDRRPDAVVVMMNPGASAPKPGFGTSAFEGRLVPAKPDAVQYQVMRLMGRAGWQHVRVVNLSDVRAAKSADLYALIERGASTRELGALFAEATHILPERIVTAPTVVCAWGVDKRLALLADEAHRWLVARSTHVLGWASSEARFAAYRYPKPVGNWALAVEWLTQLTAQAAAASAHRPA